MATPSASIAVRAAGLLRGRVSIITGASNGLGRATALAFMNQGASVVCADLKPSQRDEQATHELIREQGGKAIFVQTDVADEESIQSLISQAVKEFGRLDVMMNNAGIAFEAAQPRPIWETAVDEFEAVCRVNLRGTFLGCKYAGAQMLRQLRIEGYAKVGTIINVGSVLGLLGLAGAPAYSATKGAVVALTRAAAMDFGPHHIHCNSILPGYTRTAMISSMTDGGETERHFEQCHPLKRLGEPDEIANAAVFLASDLSKGITGVNLSVDGGLHAQLRF